MKKIYCIYESIALKGDYSFVRVSDTPDFKSEREAEKYLIEKAKTMDRHTQFFFIAPTYKFLPLDSE